MFKNLSPESRNIQTQKCAPIQCTVWLQNMGKGRLGDDGVVVMGGGCSVDPIEVFLGLTVFSHA